jgi:hypothetical protein
MELAGIHGIKTFIVIGRQFRDLGMTIHMSRMTDIPMTFHMSPMALG